MDGFFHFGDTALVNHYAPDIDVVPETPLKVTYTFLGKAHGGACV